MIRQHWSSFLFGLLSGLLAAGLVLLFISRPKRYPIQLLPAPTPSPLRIHVTGAVHHPGVYLLPTDSIWQAAIDAAGGELAEADLERINLAAELEDNQHVYIPYRAAQVTAEADSPPINLNEEGLIDINHATISELELLPGIGPSLAKSIIAFREEQGYFLEPEDLLRVSGIGPSKLELLKDLIVCK